MHLKTDRKSRRGEKQTINPTKMCNFISDNFELCSVCVCWGGGDVICKGVLQLNPVLYFETISDSIAT